MALRNCTAQRGEPYNCLTGKGGSHGRRTATPPHGPTPVFPATAWAAFADAVKDGHFPGA
ncbi:DUF397 domain-containing protein [Streptomyces sp. SID4951]|nr:DUF397 domain-containing protein [Streptomyces sp. SID4951]